MICVYCHQPNAAHKAVTTGNIKYVVYFCSYNCFNHCKSNPQPFWRQLTLPADFESESVEPPSSLPTDAGCADCGGRAVCNPDCSSSSRYVLCSLPVCTNIQLLLCSFQSTFCIYGTVQRSRPTACKALSREAPFSERDF